MFSFYSEHSAIVPQAVAQIPWDHNRLILNKVKKFYEAIWYASATLENGWTRDELELKIKKRKISASRIIINQLHNPA